MLQWTCVCRRFCYKLFFFCRCVGWGYVVAFTNVLIIYQIYIILEFTPSIIVLYSPPTTPGTVSTGITFPFTDLCTQYLHCIHPSIPFPLPLREQVLVNYFVLLLILKLRYFTCASNLPRACTLPLPPYVYFFLVPFFFASISLIHSCLWTFHTNFRGRVVCKLEFCHYWPWSKRGTLHNRLFDSSSTFHSLRLLFSLAFPHHLSTS
jgi:hypothetical protein